MYKSPLPLTLYQIVLSAQKAILDNHITDLGSGRFPQNAQIGLRTTSVNFSGVGRGSAGYGSMAIRVDEQCPSTPTVVVQENLIGRAGGLEYLIVTAPVSLSLESS